LEETKRVPKGRPFEFLQPEKFQCNIEGEL